MFFSKVCNALLAFRAVFAVEGRGLGTCDGLAAGSATARIGLLRFFLGSNDKRGVTAAILDSRGHEDGDWQLERHDHVAYGRYDIYSDPLRVKSRVSVIGGEICSLEDHCPPHIPNEFWGAFTLGIRAIKYQILVS